MVENKAKKSVKFYQREKLKKNIWSRLKNLRGKCLLLKLLKKEICMEKFSKFFNYLLPIVKYQKQNLLISINYKFIKIIFKQR